MPTLSFCPTLAELYDARRVVGRSKVYDDPADLAGLSTVNNLVTLRALLLEYQPTRTLEIGLAFGGSALVFAGTHKDLGREATRQHTAIDPTQRRSWDDAGRLNLERAGLSDFVRVIENYSHSALPTLAAANETLDMVYVDGSHQFEDVFIDFFYTNQMLATGGLILFDDSTDPQVRKVLRFIEANYQGVYEKLSLKKYRPGLKFKLATLLRKTQLTAYRKLKDGRRDWKTPMRDF